MKRISALILVTLLVVACGGSPTPTPDVVATQVAEELAVIAAQTELSPTATATPSAIPTPDSTLTPAPTFTPTPTSTPSPTLTPTPSPTVTWTPTPCQVQISTLSEKFKTFPWVAYAPTHFDPEKGVMPAEEEIKVDLDLLYEAGFRGIVTYGADDVLAEVPRLAREAGFEGVVMGIWAPGDPQETKAAVAAVAYVDGYVVGNEGLFSHRYNAQALEEAMAELRETTCRPVTTTEVSSLYDTDDSLLGLGDWVFPNAHPYWQNITDPGEAITWTQDTFDSLRARAGDIPVILKEVGLPTAGAPGLSQYQQAEYYARLRGTQVDFVYFESFDQPWKTEDGTGSHWGLFESDRSPKVASRYVVEGFPPFYVYADAGAPYNHFVPEGWMGCWQGIQLDENDPSQPQAGTSPIRITYTWQPECDQLWAGIYWWDPPGSYWCDEPGGFDLREWTKLTFWARGEKGGEVAEFKVGGLRKANGEDCDSLQPVQTTYPLVLSKKWTRYSIPLYGMDLSHVAGGFVWVTDAEETTIYLDEIRFEWSEGW